VTVASGLNEAHTQEGEQSYLLHHESYIIENLLRHTSDEETTRRRVGI